MPTQYRPAHAALLANILRTDRAAHRPLPADSELVQAIAVLAAPTPTQAARLTRSQLSAALKRAGRLRGIAQTSCRLQTLVRRTWLHQLPLVECAMAQQAMALLKPLEAAAQAAEDHLFNRFLGCLHYCLRTRQLYAEDSAFPTAIGLAA